MRLEPEEAVVDLGPRRKAAIALAQRLLRAANAVQAPVSLRVVVGHLQKDHDITLVPMNDVSSKVSGLLVQCRTEEDEYSVIGYNEKHPWCRRRFTIGHEIGHLLMGHTCEGRDVTDASHNEREADIFASELLLPSELIKKDFRSTPDLQLLAKKYIMSKEAVTRKLMDLRLL